MQRATFAITASLFSLLFCHINCSQGSLLILKAISTDHPEQHFTTPTQRFPRAQRSGHLRPPAAPKASSGFEKKLQQHHMSQTIRSPPWEAPLRASLSLSVEQAPTKASRNAHLRKGPRVPPPAARRRSPFPGRPPTAQLHCSGGSDGPGRAKHGFGELGPRRAGRLTPLRGGGGRQTPPLPDGPDPGGGALKQRLPRPCGGCPGAPPARRLQGPG